MFQWGSHPLNLALRFVLEVLMLVAIGRWGYLVFSVVWAVLLPVFAMALWVVFATRDDPSRSGKTVISTPGPLRLLLELALFAVAVAACYAVGNSMQGLVLTLVVVLHYLFSLDRLSWLFKQR
ncbi:YrdB family protein [Cryomorphaceae bacterium]|nr:YrdB family protein [Cryomorphaceae bacterium]